MLGLNAFVADTGWAAYEGTQADIFDHLIAILPEFGLRLFQQPTGLDLARALGGLGEAARGPAQAKSAA